MSKIRKVGVLNQFVGSKVIAQKAQGSWTSVWFPLLATRLAVFSILMLSLMVAAPAAAAGPADQSVPFYPTWKLLNHQEKAQFMAGYIQGWADAGAVTKIAIDFIKDNPEQAVKSLEGISKVYNVESLRPERLATLVDEFYSKPQNKGASLSVAVTAAKNSARQ